MFTLLLFIAFCGKLAFSDSYLQQFNKVEIHAERGYRPAVLSWAMTIYTNEICNANDEEIMNTNIPEQVCAEECFSAPYFCNSFLLGYQDHKLKCFHYAIKAASIDLQEYSDNIELPESSVWVDSLYEIKNEPDFVTTIAELSNTLISGPMTYFDWEDIVIELYDNPEWFDYTPMKLFFSACEKAIPYLRDIDSIREKQTLLLGNLDKKSFILALKKFHSSNPEYSPDFDKIALIFLKWFQSRDCNFSDSHYFAIDRETDNRIFVLSFSSGHYVTITREMDGYDHIIYISADGSFDRKDRNIHAAISKYLQSTDSLLGLVDGTTKLSSRVEYEDDVDLSHLGSTKAEVMQQTAIAVVGHLAATKLVEEHVRFDNPFDTTLLRDLITFVLSWTYKVRQSDFNMLEEAEILNLASKMRKTLFTGFSPGSVVNIITQY